MSSPPTPPARPLHAVTSSESLPDKGRQLLQTFDRARTDFASKYGGDDEAQTVAFCQQILERGAGDLASRFEVVHSVSCGTTSVVCHAVPRHQRASDPGAAACSPVAIKFARLVFGPNDRAGVAERRKQFEIEAKLMRRCACKHVVELIDFRPCVEGFAVFVMEYLPKTLLEHTVEANERGAHHELHAARHVKSIAEALATCHSLSIAHLDVKLDNVLCTANGEAKLCDFGLADISPVRRSAATPLYAPPEILTLGRADEKADMWSLGVVAFILLAGYPPFQPDEEHELRDNICNARYSFPPAEGWGEVSPMARDLVSRLLVLDTKTRYSAVQVLNHPWIVAAAAAPPIPPPRPPPVQVSFRAGLTGPPLLKRADSVVNLERMAHRQLIERQQSRLRSLSQFREFAEDIRRGWREGGLAGAAAVGREDPGISSLVEVAKDVKRAWKESGLKGASTALSQSRGKLRATFAVGVGGDEDEDGGAGGEEGNDDDGGGGDDDDGGLLQELHAGYSDAHRRARTGSDSVAAATVGSDTESRNSTQRLVSDGTMTTTTTTASFSTLESHSERSVGVGQLPPPPPPVETTSAVDDPPPPLHPALNPFDDQAFLKVYWGGITLQHAPAWIPDAEAVACRLCSCTFTFWNRRHHCRACGQVVCDGCSKARLVVKVVDPNKPSRVCALCRDAIAATLVTVR